MEKALTYVDMIDKARKHKDVTLITHILDIAMCDDEISMEMYYIITKYACECILNIVKGV